MTLFEPIWLMNNLILFRKTYPCRKKEKQFITCVIKYLCVSLFDSMLPTLYSMDCQLVMTKFTLTYDFSLLLNAYIIQINIIIVYYISIKTIIDRICGHIITTAMLNSVTIKKQNIQINGVNFLFPKTMTIHQINILIKTGPYMGDWNSVFL